MSSVTSRRRGLGAQDRCDVAQRCIEVERLPFGLVSRKQRTQPPDHVARTEVVAPDARHDPEQVFAAVAAGLKNQIGSIGARLHGAERLVDLVRDRGRQLAGHRQARRMGKLDALLLHRQLGRAAAVAARTSSLAINAGLKQDDGDR